MKLCHQPVLAVVFGSLSLTLCANGEGVIRKVIENTWKSSVTEGEWVSGDNWNKEGYPSASDSAAGFYGNSNLNGLDITVRLPNETNSINRLHVLHRYPSSFVFDGRGRNFSMGALGEDDLPRGSQKTTTKPDDVDGGSFYPLNIMSEVASDSTAVKISKASGDGRSAVFDWRNALMRTFSPSPKDVSVEFLGGTFDFNVDNCKNWNLEFSSSGLSHSRMLVSNSTVKCAVFAAPCNATNSTLVIDEGGELVSNGKFEFGYNNAKQCPGTNTVIVKNGGKIKFDNGGVFVNSFGFYVGSEAALCRRQEFYLSGAGSCIDLGQMAQAYFIGNTLLDVSDGASLVLPGKSALSYSAALGHRPEVSELRLSGDDSRIFISTNIVPPGYVGFEEGGQLTEKIRRKPYSVVLFDEIEKAHPDVFNILLQVLEDGVLTDSQGRRVDFKNTVLILTSNVGASQLSHTKTVGFSSNVPGENSVSAQKERMMSALKQAFRPEFLNRIDDIIVFNSLGTEEICQIANLMLRDVQARMEGIGIHVELDPSVALLLAQEGFDANYGARPLRRAVVRLVEDTFSTEMLEGRLKVGDRVTAIAQDGKIQLIQQNG